AETDSAGNVVRRFGQFPFGEVWYETGTTDKWKFTGCERDSAAGESGLDYASARFYGDGIARFMSVDQLSGNIADPESLNRYSYVSNDPVNLADPSGLLQQKICMLDENGNDSNVCVSMAGLLDDPFGRGGASLDGAPLDYIPGVGFVFSGPGGFSASIDGLGGAGLSGCIFADACPVQFPAPSIGDLLPSFPNPQCEFGPCQIDNFAANNGPSWMGAFAKSLFSWKNFSAGFKEGGCFRQFAEEAFDPAAEIAGQDAAIKMTAESGAYVAATVYSARQALIVPMRSSIVRGILRVGEVGGEAVALGFTIISEGKALGNEVDSFESGQCQ
ncbi:MAG: RHS repeat domain-containing protein, partial [Candidatus Angelobacter sp.]